MGKPGWRQVQSPLSEHIGQEKKSTEMSLVEAIEHDRVQTESRKGDVVL